VGGGRYGRAHREDDRFAARAAPAGALCHDAPGVFQHDPDLIVLAGELGDKFYRELAGVADSQPKTFLAAAVVAFEFVYVEGVQRKQFIGLRRPHLVRGVPSGLIGNPHAPGASGDERTRGDDCGDPYDAEL